MEEPNYANILVQLYSRGEEGEGKTRETGEKRSLGLLIQQVDRRGRVTSTGDGISAIERMLVTFYYA